MAAGAQPLRCAASSHPKGEPLSIAELQRLYGSFQHAHLRRFLILGLATGGRPEAIRGLEWAQVDLASRCLRLNPVGRMQTKKRRAEVPICDLLAKDEWFGPVVHFRGSAIGSLKKAWGRARSTAGWAKPAILTVCDTQWRGGFALTAYPRGRWLLCSATKCLATQ